MAYYYYQTSNSHKVLRQHDLIFTFPLITFILECFPCHMISSVASVIKYYSVCNTDYLVRREGVQTKVLTLKNEIK